MITNSNPFLRNDYYPDQNDIDELNTRINEVQSDVDLLAISVNEKTEAVNGRLNTLQNDYNESFQTEALKANTADLNVLNINVQAVIKDLNAENTYTENLTVNKPVQDLSLRTPHLENTTSLNGNFYAPNIIGGKIDNIQFENIQNFNAVNIETDIFKANVADLNVLNAVNIEADGVKANTADLNKVTANTVDLNILNADKVTTNTVDLNVLNAINIGANEVKANKLVGDFSAEPISSSAVVGYDENGQLIPIRASYDVSFPEYSDYLKTDAQGTARKGTSESAVVQSTNLIQAGAVQNMYDAVNANFNNVSNSFNAVNANFNNVSNSFNAVNESFNTINNTFIDYYTKTQADNKFVAQVAGKGLSTEDFTTAEKNKLNGIAEGATRTEVTQTVDNSTSTVPSNKAVSDGLSGKVAKTDIVQTVNSSNSSVPSCAAVATYVTDSINSITMPGVLDITVTRDYSSNTLNVVNSTNGLCAVKITKMSDGSLQYKSNLRLKRPVNKTTAFTFSVTASEAYMIEAWYYDANSQKLIPTAIKVSNG